jgi:hypothetical protein
VTALNRESRQMSDIGGLEFRVELRDEQDSHVVEVIALANNAIVRRHRARVIQKVRE